MKMRKWRFFFTAGLVFILTCLIFVFSTEKVQSTAGPLPTDSLEIALDQDTLLNGTNLSLVIHQSAVNNILATIGELTGEGSLALKTPLTKYKWTLTRPRVLLTDTGAVFHAHIRIQGLGTDFESPAMAKATIDYDKEREEIDLFLEDAIVDFKLKLLGRQLKISKLNIASFFGGKIKLLGPLPLETDFAVKKFYQKEFLNFGIVGHHVYYEPGKVIINFAVDFKKSATKDPVQLDREKEAELARKNEEYLERKY